jgi:hypothetical protein
MCGGGGSSGNSDKYYYEAQAEQRAAEEAARLAEQQEEERKLREFEAKLDQAYQLSLADAQGFFSQRGLDPSPYIDDIQTAAAKRRLSVPENTSDVMSFFDGMGQGLYDDLTAAERARLGREFDTFAGQGFANKLISSDSDDDILAAVLDEQRNDANEQLQRLLERQILTEAGYGKALGELDDQSYGARTALESIGASQLESGRGDLRDIAQEGRDYLSNLNLGDMFDTNSYQTRINDTTQTFFDNLGNSIRGSLTGDLFDVSSAYASGGAAQGAGNTAYDPSAAAGFFDSILDEEDEEDEEEKQLQPF